MPALNLANLFGSKTQKRVISFVKDDAKGPPSGKKWLILGGVIYHETGTLTVLYNNVKADNSTSHDILAIIAALTGSYVTTIFNNASTGEYGVNWRPVILDDTEWLNLQGGATAYARVTVLEWE